MQVHQTSACTLYRLMSPFFVLQFFLSSQLHASKPKQNHAPDVFALAYHNVTCRLNTFQEEPQKLKISLRTMNVSEDYCDRIITCDRWIIWKWFCAHMNCMASLHCSHLFFFFFKVQFWNCKCIRCLPDFFFLSPPSFPPSHPPPMLLSSLLSLTLLSSLLWLVEDVSNLTASDVMNRVNLGYLQGNLCAVRNSLTTCEWLHPSEKGFCPFTSIHGRLVHWVSP